MLKTVDATNPSNTDSSNAPALNSSIAGSGNPDRLPATPEFKTGSRPSWLGYAPDPASQERLVDAILELALQEDLGGGDITAEALCSGQRVVAALTVKQPCVLAGLAFFERVFKRIDQSVRVKLLCQDGQQIESVPFVAALIDGDAGSVLTAERTALNFLQRLSGVATRTRQFVELADASGQKGIRIVDTRKTTPGLRVLEKMAAAAGGIQNHRMGLWDAVLIKNNHIRLAGGVRIACERAMEAARKPGGPLGITVQVEVRTREEIEEALACGAKLLLLDNMTPAQAAGEIRWIHNYKSPGKRAKVEISGGVTLATVRAYAEAGPDYISSGAITHSATAVDINCGIYVL